MTNSAPLIISTRGLTKDFGEGPTRVQALRGVDLDVVRGEFVAIMGASGSGKSTLLHILGALDPATTGTVRIGEDNLATLSDDQLTLLRRRRIGFVFQAFNLISVLSAEENVALPLLIDGQAEATAVRRAVDALAMVGLRERRAHLPSELSGGEQQRVAVARALASEPLLLLADEPTGNLDSATSDQVMALLRGLVDNRSQTIVMVTHSPRHAALADRIIVLKDGRIVDEQRIGAARTAADVLADLESAV